MFLFKDVYKFVVLSAVSDPQNESLHRDHRVCGPGDASGFERAAEGVRAQAGRHLRRQGPAGGQLQRRHRHRLVRQVRARGRQSHLSCHRAS